MAEEALPLVEPVEAIAFFRRKGWAIGFDWRDVWAEEHARAFTVAKAMGRDLLEDIRGAVDQALEEGTTLQQFIKDLRPALVKRGWWGRKYMTDPATGESKVVQLGSPARLRTIYNTNLRTSYMAGRWERAWKVRSTLPLLRYVSVMDGRERPEHHAWHGTVLPIDDPWWDTHFPPCDWGCRCDTQSVNQRMVDRRGWHQDPPRRFRSRDYVNKRTGEVVRLEQGIGPGWGYNVGKASLDGLTPAPRVKPIAGDGGALNAWGARDFDQVKHFFAAFGLDDLQAALRGKVWRDVAGWPLAISLGLLRGSKGEMVRLRAADRRGLAAAARVLIDPARIGLVWIRGEDGRQLLVRRYQSAQGVVDMGRDFWRWSAGETARLPGGLVVWSRDAAALAAYNPRQPRDHRGRWAGSYGGAVRFIESALSGTAQEVRLDLAPLHAHGQRELARLKLSGRDKKGKVKMVALDNSLVKHAHDQHGTDSRGQAPLDAHDFMAMPALLATGRFNHGNPQVSANGARRVQVSGLVNGTRYNAAFEVRKHTIVPVTISKKR